MEAILQTAPGHVRALPLGMWCLTAGVAACAASLLGCAVVETETTDRFTESVTDHADYDHDGSAYGGYGEYVGESYANGRQNKLHVETHTFEGFRLDIESVISDGSVTWAEPWGIVRVSTTNGTGTTQITTLDTGGRFYHPDVQFSDSESAYYFIAHEGAPVYGEDISFRCKVYRVDNDGVTAADLPMLTMPGPIPKHVVRYVFNLFDGGRLSVFRETAQGERIRTGDETRAREFVQHLTIADFQQESPGTEGSKVRK